MGLSNGSSFIQIGSDGGLLEEPVVMDEIMISPAERVDVIIDFSAEEVGTNIVLTNDAETPFPFGDAPDPETTGRIMQFRVIPRTEEDTSEVPAVLSNIEGFNFSKVKRIRDITFDVTNDEFSRLKFLLNNSEFDDYITEKIGLGDTEIWRIINPGIAAHPFHIHLVQFQILDRT